MPLDTGDTLSRYRLVEKIGEGGMGAVFRANDQTLKRDVAIKVLLEGTLADEASRRRFRNEALALSRLNHPNIETVHDFDSQGGQDFLVLELVPGPTLSERLAGGALGEQETLTLGVQLAQGLAAAHDQGIIHRDLKPSNVKITPEGRLKILDFGLARLRGRKEEPDGTRSLSGTRTQGVSGTLPYMAPEQLLGEELDARTDIYALGAVLYEMATGKLAFMDELTPRLTDAILHRAPASPQSVNPEISPELEALIMRCLEKKPERRYGSVGELEVELRRLRGGADPHTTTLTGLARPVARKRRWIPIGALGLVLVAAFASWLLVQRARQNRAVRELVEQLQPLATDGRLDEIVARLGAAGMDIDDAGLAPLAERVAGRLSVRTDPPGAVVNITRVQPIEGFDDRAPTDLGVTPASRLLIGGEYLLRFSAPEGGVQLALTEVKPGESLTVERALSSAWPGMVSVPPGPSPAAPHQSVAEVFIDRHEVTNEEYQEFVAVGGYDDTSLWSEKMWVGGLALDRGAALARFVDRTGLAGPRHWSNGTFADGLGRHPVVGVSWHEAVAYAGWAGKRLPTRAEWWRAALEDSGWAYPWGDEARTAELRANFGLVGTAPAGSHPLGISPRGCFDIAGNAREWVADVEGTDPTRIVVGGSWDDPVYMFEDLQAQQFDPDYADDTIGFRLAATPPD